MRSLIPNSTQVPDLILDFWMAELSGAEFKVLMYVVRRTYGFGKDGDTISLRQLVSGIVTSDRGTGQSRVLDRGTGLNKDTVTRALQTLEAKGIIERVRRDSDEHGHMANHYRLNLDAELLSAQKGGDDRGDGPLSDFPTSPPEESAYPLVGKSDKPPGENRQGLVGKSDKPLSENPTNKRQKKQETEEQETATAERPQNGAGVVVALSPSAEGKNPVSDGVEHDRRADSEAQLRAVGFSASVAKALSHHDPEIVRSQIEALSGRKAGKNPLGMLRKAIEEGWAIPKTLEETRREEGAQRQEEARRREEAHSTSQRARGIQTLQRLETSAPEAYSAFLKFVSEQKAQAQSSAVARRSERFRESLESLYVSEEKRIELLPQFIRRFGATLPGIEGLSEAAK